MASNNATHDAYEKAATDTSVSTHGPSPHLRRIANPAPLGLFSFASTTFILSLYNVGTRSIVTPNVVVGMAFGCGGLAQLLAGQWEFVCGNTFGATAFSSYGAFWFSFGLIYWPGSGILDAYKSKSELESALGIYLITWFMVTLFFFIAALRTHAAFVNLFGSLALTFLLLACGAFTGMGSLNKAGGALGIVAALVAYYTGCAQLFNRNDTFFTLPLFKFRED